MRDVGRCMLVLALGAMMVVACDPASPAPKPTPPANSPAGLSTSPLAARQASSHRAFATPEYFDWVSDDAFFNTVGPSGDIITTANDSIGVHFSCTRRGADVAILALHGPDPRHLRARTVN